MEDTSSQLKPLGVMSKFNNDSDSANLTIIFSEGVSLESTIVLFYICSPLAVLGVCANVLIFVVWSAESSFNPTTFLMKCLAVVDIALLTVKFCLYTLIRLQISHMQQFMWLVISLHYGRILSVHSTLALVLSRWVAVCKPLKTKHLLTKHRVVTGYVLVVTWCMLIGLPTALMLCGVFPDVYENYMIKDQRAFFWILFTGKVVHLALPILTVGAFSLSIIYTVCQRRRQSTLEQQSGAQQSAFQRLVVAVLCVSLTTFVSYPVSIVVDLLSADERIACDYDCQWVAIAELLEDVNSAVNFIYYLVFLSHFRHLCNFRLRQCCWFLSARS